MTKETHTTLTISDAANAEADALFKACRFDEAVRSLETFLAASHPLPAEERLRTHANLAACERGRGNYRKALNIHLDAAALADDCRRTAPKMCGRFHNGLGATYLGLTGDDPDNEDRAIESFTAASVFYETAGEYRLKADVENNLAMVHAKAGRIEQAMVHVALALESCPADEAVRAQVEDTRAHIALAAGDDRAALEFSNASVARLLPLDDENLLAKSVETSVKAGGAYLRIREEQSIRATLAACDWNLTRAAHRLGFNSLQAFKNHLRRHFPRLDKERLNKSVQSKRIQ